MRDFIVFLPITILYLIFKSTLMPTVPLPDLPLIIVFYLAYTRASTEGVLLCFVLGYVDDVLGGGIMGTTSFALVFTYALIHILSKRVQFSSYAAKAVGAGGAALIKGTLTFFVWSSMSENIFFLKHVTPVTITTAIFAPLIISLFSRIRALKRLGTAEGGIS